jgi:hypothetical protein
MLTVADVDAWFNRAIGAGCTITMPPQDMFGATASGSSRIHSGWGDQRTYEKVRIENDVNKHKRNTGDRK